MENKQLETIIAYLETKPRASTIDGYDKQIYDLLYSLPTDLDYQENFYLIDNKPITELSLEEIGTYYTFISRSERFCLGAIQNYIDDGTLLALSRQQLVKSSPGSNDF